MSFEGCGTKTISLYFFKFEESPSATINKVKEWERTIDKGCGTRVGFQFIQGAKDDHPKSWLDEVEDSLD
jgi:hypothetical protein